MGSITGTLIVDIIFDEDEIISFLNEYYTVNPDQLPEKTFF